ncbi:MAG: zinc ribbon domain-containing protein [Desulfobulbaceae bacterium]|nr:MAG: zinc ribbon domain-containing protein [Desulfobulbaceae bacterium]
MPIYEFKCNDCGNEFEELLKSSDISEIVCPECKSKGINKIMSSGSFKLGGGSGISNLPSGPPCGKSGFS